MYLSRQLSLNNLEFFIAGGVNAYGVLEQGLWLTIVGRYRASTQEYWLTVNNALGSYGTASANIIDKTSTTSRLGSLNFNGDMAGVFVVDEYLSTDTTSAIADAMVRGVDVDTSSVPAGSVTACTCNAGFSGPDGGPCTPCEAGKYKALAGSSTCSACPSNSNSPAGSAVLTSCTCNAGSTGPNGGPCATVICVRQCLSCLYGVM